MYITSSIYGRLQILYIKLEYYILKYIKLTDNDLAFYNSWDFNCPEK